MLHAYVWPHRTMLGYFHVRANDTTFIVGAHVEDWVKGNFPKHTIAWGAPDSVIETVSFAPVGGDLKSNPSAPRRSGGHGELSRDRLIDIINESITVEEEWVYVGDGDRILCKTIYGAEEAADAILALLGKESAAGHSVRKD